MASGRQERPPWISGPVAITSHTIDRVKERLTEKFHRVPRDVVARQIAGKVCNPDREAEPWAAIQNGAFQVALPFINRSTGEEIGHLIVGLDAKRAGVFVVTLLDPEMVKADREGNRRMGLTFDGLPRWWAAFQSQMRSERRRREAAE